MCIYCNHDAFTHYLLNGEPLIENTVEQSILPQGIGTATEDRAIGLCPPPEAIVPELVDDRSENMANNIDLVDSETTIEPLNFVAAESNVLPNISINNIQTTDSSVGRELTFAIVLDAVGSEIVTVDYATADITAVAGEDYLPVEGTITFNPGEINKTVTVNTTGTSYLDIDESFALNLSNATNANLEDSQGEGTILPAYAGIRGGSRNQEVVTFSFFDEDVFGQGGYDGSKRESNAREPSEIVKANYRQIFDHLNTFVDRTFVEVEESESTIGDIRIVVSDGPNYAYAGGHIHLAGWAAASDAGGNGWESGQGVYAYSALMHELGHAIGMPHSFGKSTSVFDPEENASNTVMSYTYPGNSPATFMAYDIKSLQERYGAAEYRPEDTVYEFLTVDNYVIDGEIAIDTTRHLKQTIWDSGGIDTFDFSGLEFDDSGYRFDLNQSKYQTTQDGYQGSSYNRDGTTYYVPTYGTSIAIDVVIENLINSSSDDIIIANSAAVLISI
ncbi:Calx-beta domain-containing protein [Pleurocapsa sp. PCC 7319]|uniref:Calx-beta domain-containing protein n=1 Tax=Pleurocapsa sp. PCC 7319 TaxID=118161 RepID=UPI000347C9E0|nr:Calx-beta domain-containing protein [Pleurocapsa sp. PCC 7319]